MKTYEELRKLGTVYGAVSASAGHERYALQRTTPRVSKYTCECGFVAYSRAEHQMHQTWARGVAEGRIGWAELPPAQPEESETVVASRVFGPGTLKTVVVNVLVDGVGTLRMEHEGHDYAAALREMARRLLASVADTIAHAERYERDVEREAIAHLEYDPASVDVGGEG